MSAHSSGVVRGVIVTLQGTGSNGCVDSSGRVYDFVSRYFAPWVGIPEDPVTGKSRRGLRFVSNNSDLQIGLRVRD